MTRAVRRGYRLPTLGPTTPEVVDVEDNLRSDRAFSNLAAKQHDGAADRSG
jgi:hypothetical protein